MKREEILEVYKEECSKCDKTRERQWKINIALWTLLALAIWFFDNKKIDSCPCLVIFAALLFILGHILFIYLTQRALNAYKLRANDTLYALNNSNEDLIDFKLKYFDKVQFDGWNMLWVICQILPTIVLLIFFLIRVQH